MTATERFYAGSKEDIISMDDEALYGETFAQMSFKEAIDLNLLTDYKVIAIDVKKKQIQDFIKENHLIQLNDKWNKETEVRSLASMLALRKAMTVFPIGNAVSFHSSIEKAVRNKEIQEYISQTYSYEAIETFTVSGKIPTSIRNNIIREFGNSEGALITNARCLTEGVDVPSIDCIVFADPKRSKVDIVQALGRALRKKEGKEWGYVVIPVIYDDETGEVDNENFQEILAVIRGLASNDERIVDYFEHDSSKVNSHNSVNNSEKFQFQVFSNEVTEDDLKSQLRVRMLHNLRKLHWMPFKEAIQVIHPLKLINHDAWKNYCTVGEKPKNIPSNPQHIYKDKGWKGWNHWLNIAGENNERFLSYNEAQEFVQSLNLKNVTQWRKYLWSGKRPHNIPSTPSAFYKNEGWKGWNHWLRGTKKSIRRFKSYDEAKKYLSSVGINNYTEWRKYYKTGEKPDDIPSNPNITYKNDGWTCWNDFFEEITGKENKNTAITSINNE